MNQSQTGKLRTRREIKRRRRRERQVMVFGVLAIALGAVGYAAMSVYNGEAEGPFAATTLAPVSGVDKDVRLACPPANAFPLDSGEVVVRTLNGTEVAGLAGGVQEMLAGRGFVTVGAGNWSRSYAETVRIMFGVDGVHQAYTLAGHFEDAELVVDTREGSVVDLVLGEKFEISESVRMLLAPEVQPDAQLAANFQCLPAHLINAEPAPRTIPENPLEPEPTASPSATPEPEVNDGEALD